MIKKPENIDEEKYYAQYIHKANGEDLIESLNDGLFEVKNLVDSLKEEDGLFRYQEGKWTIKQVLLHMSDAEYILTYRALKIARGDQQNLSGFDENEFAKMDNSADLSLAEIMKLITSVRHTTISLFTSFNDALLEQKGMANGTPMTPRMIGWFSLGHHIHHMEVLKQHYLSKL